jgi:hypothetical protein
MKTRQPTKQEAETFLKKMEKYPDYQDECVTFWKASFNCDHSKTLEKVRTGKK